MGTREELLGLKKNRCVPLPCRKKKKKGSVVGNFFYFFYQFLFNKIRSKMFLWVTFH